MRDDRSRFSAEFRLQELEAAVIQLYQQVQALTQAIYGKPEGPDSEAADDSAE